MDLLPAGLYHVVITEYLAQYLILFLQALGFGLLSCERLTASALDRLAKTHSKQDESTNQRFIRLPFHTHCPLSLPFLTSINTFHLTSTTHHCTHIVASCPALQLTTHQYFLLIGKTSPEASSPRSLTHLLSPQRSKRPLLVFLSARRKAFEKSSPCTEQKSIWTSTPASRSPSAFSRRRTAAAPSKPQRLTSRVRSTFHRASSASDGTVNSIPPQPRTIDIVRREFT